MYNRRKSWLKINTVVTNFKLSRAYILEQEEHYFIIHKRLEVYSRTDMAICNPDLDDGFKLVRYTLSSRD
jgi:hypothetical protein